MGGRRRSMGSVVPGLPRRDSVQRQVCPCDPLRRERWRAPDSLVGESSDPIGEVDVIDLRLFDAGPREGLESELHDRARLAP